MFRISLKGKLQSKIDWLIIKFNFVSFCRNPKKSNVSQPATSFVNVVKSEDWKTRKFVVFRRKSPINEVLFTIETVIRISGPIHQVQFVSHCEKKIWRTCSWFSSSSWMTFTETLWMCCHSCDKWKTWWRWRFKL